MQGVRELMRRNTDVEFTNLPVHALQYRFVISSPAGYVRVRGLAHTSSAPSFPSSPSHTSASAPHLQRLVVGGGPVQLPHAQLLQPKASQRALAGGHHIAGQHTPGVGCELGLCGRMQGW